MQRAVRTGRRLHHDAVPRQSARRRARRHGSEHRGDAALRALDEPLGDDLRAAADVARGRLPGAHLHARRSRLPFAGHPTLGTCHAWLELGGGVPKRGGVIVQECGVGLVPVRTDRAGARVRGAAAAALRRRSRRSSTQRIAGILGIERDGDRRRRVGRQRPRLGSASCSPTPRRCSACGPASASSTSASSGRTPRVGPADFEVRAFFPKDGAVVEDPVTGSLNASLAQWLLGSGRARAPYVAQPGHGPRPRRPRAHLDRRRRGDLGRRRHRSPASAGRSTSKSAFQPAAAP